MPPENGLRALPGFLQLLNNITDVDDVAQALVDGPLRPLRTSAAFIANYDRTAIRVLGAFGFPPAIVARYSVMAMEHEWPAHLAVMNNEIVALPLREMLTQFPSLVMDRDLWSPVLEQTASDALVGAVPITSRGLVQGVYGFVTEAGPEGSMRDSTLLLGIAAAIGLWLNSHGHVGAHHKPLDFTGELPLLLTERQQRILHLVAEGRTNTRIAVELGFSVSTVKLDLNRAMRILRVTDRLATAQRARELGLLLPHSLATTERFPPPERTAEVLDKARL